MRILVLEDDRVQQGRIEQTLLDIGRSRNLRLEIDIAKNYGDVEKYSQYFDHYQLYLLDLEIDGERERGFQVAQHVRERDPFTSIVFVSTHSEALPLAFRYHLSALDFISKDQPEEDYRHQLGRCLDYVLAVDKRENMRLFTYSFEGRRGFTLPYHEILAFETSVESHRIKVYYANHSIKTIYGSLKDIAAKAEKDYFVYANRNTLVSLQAIEEMTATEVTLLEGLHFPVSRTARRTLKKHLNV